MKIAKINIKWSDDSLSPPLTTLSTRKSKFPGAKLVTRNILEDLSENDNSDIQVSKKTESEHDLNGDGNNTQKKSIKDIMIKVAPLVPDISETLMDLIEKSDVSTTNIDELIEKVESLKINSSRTPRTKNFKDKTKLTIVDYNKNVDRAIELLKNVTTNEKADENIDSFMSTKVDKQIQNQKTPHEKKFFKTGLLKEYKESAKKLHPNNEIYNRRMTRSSLRRRED